MVSAAQAEPLAVYVEVLQTQISAKEAELARLTKQIAAARQVPPEALDASAEATSLKGREVRALWCCRPP